MARRVIRAGLAFLGGAALLAGAPAAWAADEAGTPAELTALEDALLGGKPIIDLRYRYENVDDDAFAEEADANTVRARLGYETGAFYGFSALFELEAVRHIGAEDFNDTINGKPLPVVADPDSEDVNQLFLAYTGIPDTRVAAGRQRVVWHNMRFIGDAGWRQNQQTYDGVTLVNKSLPDTTVSYFYMLQANRVFGEDSPVGTFDTDNHSFYLQYDRFAEFVPVAYGHFFDIQDLGNSLSSRTLGARVSGKIALEDSGVAFPYAAEYAWQADNADNRADFSENYFLIEPAVSYAGLTGTFGFEVLSGNGTSAFQTPFASVHAFQGWADKFVVTPPAGVEDLYGSIKYVLSNAGVLDGLTLLAVYHDFNAENVSTDYGSEIDLLASKTWYEHFTTLVKYANYNADRFATDTQKLWVELDIKY